MVVKEFSSFVFFFVWVWGDFYVNVFFSGVFMWVNVMSIIDFI